MSFTNGAGRDQAGRGLSLGREKRLREAIKSVPRLEFDETGTCRIESPTAKIKTGLTVLAAKPDRKILDETGEKKPVWTLCHNDDNSITIVHKRYAQQYRDRCEYQRLTESVGFIQFKGKMASFTPENDEQEKGLKILIKKHRWMYEKDQSGRYLLAKAS